MKMNSKKGSALLIVLGLMSFLIISAVSFSVYMRQSRMPSSFLRRTASSRQIVKAALAEAIDEIDRGIGSYPHPGVPNEGKNAWRNRIYLGTNMLASVTQTVPVLTLEALAYIPAPLVNAARYYSRRSYTSSWKTLNYDAGRYAYTAIDVSDYFDVNRLFADKPRSSDPARRITLSYIFEQGKDHASPPQSAGEWDTFMEKFREVDDDLKITYSSKYPLISVCDYNLALGDNGEIGGVKSYFYEYINATGSRAGFYNSRSEDDEDRVERQTFVTDYLQSGNKRTSLAYNSSAESPVADLSNSDNQPFRLDDLSRENASVAQVILGELCQTKKIKPRDDAGNEVKDSSGGDFLWQNHIGGLGLAALWDYLDYDQVPLSLAIPSCERIPMIAGIEPMLKNEAKLKLERTISHNTLSVVEPETPGGEKKTIIETTVKYRLSLKELIDMTSLVKAVVVYPFNHLDEMEASDIKYKIDGRFSFFFTRDSAARLRSSKGDKIHPQASSFSAQTAAEPQNAQIFVNLSPQGVPMTFDPSQIKEERDAVKMASGAGSTSLLSLGNALSLENSLAEEGNMFLELKYKWTLKEGQDQDSFFLSNVMRNPSTANDDGSTYLQSARTPWRPLDEKLVPQEEGFTDEELLSKLKGGYGAAAAKLYLNSAVWLRVQSDGDDSKVVDMVPACFEDDAQSGSSGGVGSMLMAEMGKEICGESFPLMKFDTQGSEGQNVEFNFSVEDLDKMCETPRSVSLYPKSAIVSDPRWNFAPEYWYNAGATLSEDVWLDNCQRQQGDGDIFMATSDQGYLQSKYELAFLPRITRMVPSNGAQIIGNMASLKTTPRVSLPGSFNDTVNKSYMWRMFDPIDEDYEAFRDLPFMSAGRGVKVNPYSDSTNVIMAAFANTPVDWRMSSTNNLEDLLSLNATDFNKKYAYCAYADESAYKVAWDELTLLAGEFMDRMRNSPKLDWTENWIDFDWFGDSTKLWGHEFQNARFWGVDKRFLYGFWSDCFAANQQLFLVFVRAEPIMMGGGSINHVPPQLGARAVALVWRDPSMPREPNAPHKTRVLFYRQFE